MNIILITLAIIASPFLLAFILGAVKASKAGSDKIRRARAKIFLSQMSEEQRKVLKDIFIAYKVKDIEKANGISEKVSLETISFLIDFFDYDNRPAEYSSGEAGKIFWVDFEDKLRKMGYSENVSKIIPGVIMDNYSEALEKMASKE